LRIEDWLVTELLTPVCINNRAVILPLAINFLPATCWEEGAYPRTDETKERCKYGLSSVTGADEILRGAVIVDGGASSKTNSCPYGGPDKRVTRPMA
jgi:hypothetical protein